jgi:YVTN family beta-propeller protein
VAMAPRAWLSYGYLAAMLVLYLMLAPSTATSTAMPTSTLTPSDIRTNAPSATTAETPTPGRRAYVTNFSSDTVSVIDTATNVVVGDPIPVGNSPWGVAVGPDGARAYVTDATSGTVSVIDTAANTVLTVISNEGINPSGVGVAP